MTGTGGTWSVNSAGIHTLSNVGIGTTNPTNTLTVYGPNATIRINDTASNASTTIAYGSITLNSNGVIQQIGDTQYFRAGQNGSSSYYFDNYYSGFSHELFYIDTNGSIRAAGDAKITGITTSQSFRTNSTVGDGTDVGFAIKYYITANGSSAYRFAGPGVLNTTDDPTIYLHRGFTYIFENSTGGSHPFAIRYSSGGTGYGSTYLSGSQTGTQIFTVPFDAPPTLVYQCTIHGSMLGTFNIVT